MCSVLVDGGKREGLQPRDPSADRDGRGADLDPIAQDHGPLVGSAENDGDRAGGRFFRRSEEHTSELQSLMRISYAVFCLKQKTQTLSVTNIYDTNQPITKNNMRIQLQYLASRDTTVTTQ